MSNIARWGRWAASLVPVSLVLAVAGFGAILPDYSQWRHPVALLGATGIPHAQAFSALGFALPGLLAATAAVGMLIGARGRMQRVGLQLLLLSGLAFCGLGLLPLDPTDLDSRASQYHATAWLLWVLAFVPGAGLLGLWLRRQPGDARLGARSLLAAVLLALLSLLPPGPWLPAPLAQRLAFLVWAAWWPLAACSWPWQRAVAHRLSG
ncbi:MAG: DUF998 domain-containing protein [Pseudomonas sp.]